MFGFSDLNKEIIISTCFCVFQHSVFIRRCLERDVAAQPLAYNLVTRPPTVLHVR
jgi:hypothetical protein